MARTYEVDFWLVPWGKMKARLASWEYKVRVQASSALRALVVATKDEGLKQELRSDKFLRQAVRRGGLNGKATCLEDEGRRKKKE